MARTMINPLEAWTTVIFLCDWPEHGEHAPAITQHLRDRAAGFDRPIQSGIATSAKSAQGLVESPLDLFRTSENPALARLVAWCEGCVRNVVSAVNGKQVAPADLRVEFTESWFHITNDGGFHDAHTHGACSWCGIYYLDPGDAEEVPADGSATAGNGVNRFYAPIGIGGMLRDYGNAWLGRQSVDIQPMEGRLALFPAYLMHSGLPYRGTRDRMIISFNSRTWKA